MASAFRFHDFGGGNKLFKETKMKYKLVVEKDEDGCFVAECLTLPGCISQGKTLKAALCNIGDAIKGYLESMNKHNEVLRG